MTVLKVHLFRYVFRAVAVSEIRGGGHILLGGDNVPPALVEIGLTGRGGGHSD